ncbi:MAG TPA: hypothetical protein VG756_04580 [Pseudonocardiaceae bacterium]|nr:hypothetical protein [Pseudonocardiaceae bacterium]
MTKALLAIHVLAAIIAIGPVTVAASMFPAAARRAAAEPDAGTGTLVVLHRICQVYAVVALAVPVFGLATAANLHVLGSAWLIASIILTVLAAAVLALVMLPGQARVLAAPAPAARLAMATGGFNLLWAAVTVLMIIRPGSTTGV